MFLLTRGCLRGSVFPIDSKVVPRERMIFCGVALQRYCVLFIYRCFQILSISEAATSTIPPVLALFWLVTSGENLVQPFDCHQKFPISMKGIHFGDVTNNHSGFTHLI